MSARKLVATALAASTLAGIASGAMAQDVQPVGVTPTPSTQTATPTKGSDLGLITVNGTQRGGDISATSQTSPTMNISAGNTNPFKPLMGMIYCGTLTPAEISDNYKNMYACSIQKPTKPKSALEKAFGNALREVGKLFVTPLSPLMGKPSANSNLMHYTHM